MALDRFYSGEPFPIATMAALLSSVNAAAALETLAIPNGEASILKVTGVANHQGAAGRAMFGRTLLVHATAGVVVIDRENVDDDFPNGTVWTLTITAVGATVQFAFVGEAAATIDLELTVKLVPMGGGA